MNEKENFLDDDDDDFDPTKDRGNESAVVRLINHIFKPSKENIMDLTVIPKTQSLKIATTMALSKASDPNRHEYYTLPSGKKVLKRWVPLDEIAMQYYFHLQRSVDGRLLDSGIILAESQELDMMGEEGLEMFRGQ